MTEIPTLLEHLEKHRRKRGVGGIGVYCKCGWRFTEGSDLWFHHAHVAEAWQEARTIREAKDLEALPDYAVVREDPEHGSGRIMWRDRYYKSGWTRDEPIEHSGATPPELPALVLHTPRDEASR